MKNFYRIAVVSPSLICSTAALFGLFGCGSSDSGSTGSAGSGHASGGTVSSAGAATSGGGNATGGSATGGSSTGSAGANGGMTSAGSGGSTGGSVGSAGAPAGGHAGSGGGATGYGGKGGATSSAGNGGSSAGGGSGGTSTGMSAGCGKAPTIASSMYNNGTSIPITAANMQRRYILNVPTNYDNTKPYKLVIAYHARDSNDHSVYNEKYYGMLPLSNNTTIFVAPNGQKKRRALPGDRGGRCELRMAEHERSGHAARGRRREAGRGELLRGYESHLCHRVELRCEHVPANGV